MSCFGHDPGRRSRGRSCLNLSQRRQDRQIRPQSPPARSFAGTRDCKRGAWSGRDSGAFPRSRSRRASDVEVGHAEEAVVARGVELLTRLQWAVCRGCRLCSQPARDPAGRSEEECDAGRRHAAVIGRVSRAWKNIEGHRPWRLFEVDKIGERSCFSQ